MMHKHKFVLTRLKKKYMEANMMTCTTWGWPDVACVARAGQAGHSHPRKRAFCDPANHSIRPIWRLDPLSFAFEKSF
jgi:hypothetical protein